MVLDASVLNMQKFKERIKGKVEQSREKSTLLAAPPLDYGPQLYFYLLL